MQCPKCSYEPTMTEVQHNPNECPKCGVIYAKAKAAQTRAAQPDAASSVRQAEGHKPSNGKTAKYAVFALLLIGSIAGLSFAGYKGYQSYERAQFIKEAEVYVRGATVHLEQMIETQKNPGSMTFQELFNKAAKSVEEIDGLVVKVSMLDGQQDIKNASVEYMKSAQDVVRGISGTSRALLQMSSAVDRIERSREKYINSTNEYVEKYAKESWDEAVIDSEEAIKKARESNESLKASMKRAQKAADALIWFSDDSKPRIPLEK